MKVFALIFTLNIAYLFGNEQRYDKDINGALISNGKVHLEALSVIKKYVKNF